MQLPPVLGVHHDLVQLGGVRVMLVQLWLRHTALLTDLPERLQLLRLINNITTLQRRHTQLLGRLDGIQRLYCLVW